MRRGRGGLALLDHLEQGLGSVAAAALGLGLFEPMCCRDAAGGAGLGAARAAAVGWVAAGSGSQCRFVHRPGVESDEPRRRRRGVEPRVKARPRPVLRPPDQAGAQGVALGVAAQRQEVARAVRPFRLQGSRYTERS